MPVVRVPEMDITPERRLIQAIALVSPVLPSNKQTTFWVL